MPSTPITFLLLPSGQLSGVVPRHLTPPRVTTGAGLLGAGEDGCAAAVVVNNLGRHLGHGCCFAWPMVYDGSEGRGSFITVKMKESGVKEGGMGGTDTGC